MRWSQLQAVKVTWFVHANMLLPQPCQLPSPTASVPCLFHPSPPNLQLSFLIQSHETVRNSGFCFISVIALTSLSRREGGREIFAFHSKSIKSLFLPTWKAELQWENSLSFKLQGTGPLSRKPGDLEGRKT